MVSRNKLSLMPAGFISVYFGTRYRCAESMSADVTNVFFFIGELKCAHIGRSIK